MPRPVIVYTRRSTAQQALSPSAQFRLAQQWADREGRKIALVVNDETSGGTDPLDRPAFVKALDRAEQEGADVVVTVWDRFSRDTAGGLLAYAAAKARGVSLLAASGRGNGDSPEDKFIRTLDLALAELERQKIRRRTREALQAKRSKGEPVGRAPFGWTYQDGALTPVEAEQATIARIVQLRAEGGSWKAVAAAMTAEGGKRWHPTQVRRVHARAVA